MRFGRIALEDAEGALLGHSVTVKKERLKKGRRLTAADIALLRRVGHADIIGARLAAGDVREDEAAERIARCLAGAPPALRKAVHRPVQPARHVPWRGPDRPLAGGRRQRHR